MSSNGNNNNNNAAASSSSNNLGRGGAQPATTSIGRGVGRGAGRGAGRGRGQPGGGSCHQCGQMGHFARNCPQGNNTQRAPPRGGSTANRGRGGSVAVGQSANPPAATTPVAAGPNVMDSPPPAKDMASLSLTAQPSGSPPASATSPTVSPRASAPTSPISRPGPGDSNNAADADIPPIQWEPAKPEEASEQHRLFLAYYKEKGFAFSEAKKMFLPRAHDYRAEYDGETYLRNTRVQQGGFGADKYDEEFVTYTRPASALPELEQKRLRDLAEAREKLARAQQAPDSPDKAKTVRGLEKEVRLLENPLEQFVPPPVGEPEDMNRRQVAIPSDIAGNNSRRDTLFKFGHIFQRMSAVGALGLEEVPGPDLKLVKKNRIWSEGDVWRPVSDSKDWAESADESAYTSTFHGFIPRHPRPHGIGLGHLGYDSVYTRSRDGVWYTAQDVPDMVWDEARDAPIRFEGDDGSKFVVDRPLKEDNPAINRKPAPKSLALILSQNQAANAGRGTYQGRGHTTGRGRGAGGQVAQNSPNAGWH